MRLFLSDALLEQIEVLAREQWMGSHDWIRNTLYAACDDLMGEYAAAEEYTPEEWLQSRLNQAFARGANMRRRR